ncbi:LysR family transcriptional regulator [Vogesella alkaliphila]|uniref:Transcriptional regulator n=1 Tax=Vogesella alkaliphila TaxID=1193621 RepID=A0ABQ2Z4N9_9NEIS|nr:LysR substrate-binding domain-containing protein [Vogesella alkaliphila]GGY01201.1 transcriptional regulator [Vogesella alkaliphila]
MRLRQVEIFQAILQTGSLSAAAELLCISQPAVSKTLMHAEQQLGFALFERVKGKLYPTPEAVLLQKEVGVLFDDLQRVKRLANGLRHKHGRPLQLEVTPALAQSLLPKVLTVWRKEFPDVQCSLATHHTAEIVQRLCLHEADLGLTMQRVNHPGIVLQPLASGYLSAIAQTGWWSSAELEQDLPVQALHGIPFVGLNRNDMLWSELSLLLDNHGISPQVLTTVQTYQLACDLVAQGHGLSVVDPFTANSQQNTGIQRRVIVPKIPVCLYAMHAIDSPLAFPAQKLIGLLRETVRSMGFVLVE